MNSRLTRVLVGFVAALAIIASGCGSNNSSSNGSSNGLTGQLSMMVSDNPTNDWATVGVKVLSISLKPQGGGTPVVVFTAPSPAPMINLVELDQLAEIIGNVSVPVGTYTGATLTLSANPGDVVLTASSDPDPGFAGTAGATVPSSQIQIQGATGSTGNLTVPLNERRDVPDRMVAEGTVEIHQPDRAASAQRSVGNNEGRMREIEFQIQGVILIGGYDQR